MNIWWTTAESHHVKKRSGSIPSASSVGAEYIELKLAGPRWKVNAAGDKFYGILLDVGGIRPMHESRKFCQRGSNIDNFFLVDEEKGGSKYNYKRAIIGPPAKRR